MTIGDTFTWQGRQCTVLDIRRDANGIVGVCVRRGSRPARWFTSPAAIDEIMQARAKSLMAVLL